MERKETGIQALLWLFLSQRKIVTVQITLERRGLYHHRMQTTSRRNGRQDGAERSAKCEITVSSASVAVSNRKKDHPR